MRHQTLSTAGTAAVATVALVFTGAMMAQSGPRGRAADNSASPRSGTMASAQPLTADETQWLAFMREEEKLARDVYQQLYEKWRLQIFASISASEERHFEAVGNHLDRHGIPDPSANLPAGVYSNPELAALYYELMEKGTRSLNDALETGVIIETADIADLEAALTGTTNVGLKRLYANLLEASTNHLEAFESGLDIACQANPAGN